jgi:hypothetical protein
MKNLYHDHRHLGRTLALMFILLTVGGIAILWGWNTFAVEILSQRTMQFRHALALELFVLSVAGACSIAWRFFGIRRL